MANPGKLFIRGGQLFLHNVRMFVQVGKQVLLALVISFILCSGLLFIINTSPDERYIAQQFSKAQLLIALQRQPKQLIRMPNGQSQLVYSTTIVQSPAIINRIEQLKQVFIMSAIESLLVCSGLLVLIVKWLQQRGKNQSKARIIRGSQLVDTTTLQKQIKKTKQISPYHLAGVPLPKDSETQHIQVVGTTGTGKTAVIRALLATIRARGERAIIYDKGGAYLAQFYCAQQDNLLNPLDSRTRSWNVWAECDDKADFEALAEALIPMPIGNSIDPFWIKAARMIFVSTVETLKDNPKRSNLLLMHYLLTTDLNRIQQLLRHTESEALVSEKVQKTALNIKMVMISYLKSLLYLQEEGTPFSIRQWILNEQQASWLFVSSDGRKHPTIRPLISAWINTATKELLSLTANPKRRIWFILDELASLHALPFLATVQAESRKFGGCFVLGHHGASQLRAIYGQDNAASLSNLCSTRLYLRLPEQEDAELASRNLGTYEIEEVNEAVSYGANTLRDGISVSRHSKEKRLVLPTEIQLSNDLQGYLRVKGDFPAAKVTINYPDYPIQHPPFMAAAVIAHPLRQKVTAMVAELDAMPSAPTSANPLVLTDTPIFYPTKANKGDVAFL